MEKGSLTVTSFNNFDIKHKSWKLCVFVLINDRKMPNVLFKIVILGKNILESYDGAGLPFVK
jgi:hypothetical protein